MRRHLATAVIAVIVILATGCSGTRDGAAPGSTPASGAPDASASAGSSPGGVTGTAGGNAAEVCADAMAASGESVQVYIAELGKMLQATGSNDTVAVQEAERRAQGALDDWAATMREQSGRATDPQLKTVLAEIGTEVATMRADISSIDETTLDRLQQRLDQLCGA